MTGTSLQVTKTPRRHNKYLVLIAVYKLLQALLFVAIGVGALRLLHKDIDDVLMRVAHDLRFNTESRFVDFVLERASLLTKMKADAAIRGTAMMTTSMMKATIRRASTPSNSSGFAKGS